MGWRGPALRSGPDPCRRPIQALETVPSVPQRLGTGTELPRGTTTTASQRSASHRRKGHTASPGRTSSDGFHFIPGRTIQSHSFRVLAAPAASQGIVRLRRRRMRTLPPRASPHCFGSPIGARSVPVTAHALPSAHLPPSPPLRKRLANHAWMPGPASSRRHLGPDHLCETRQVISMPARRRVY